MLVFSGLLCHLLEITPIISICAAQRGTANYIQEGKIYPTQTGSPAHETERRSSEAWQSQVSYITLSQKKRTANAFMVTLDCSTVGCDNVQLIQRCFALGKFFCWRAFQSQISWRYTRDRERCI